MMLGFNVVVRVCMLQLIATIRDTRRKDTKDRTHNTSGFVSLLPSLDFKLL
jgi:hypothetical protein